VTKTIWHKTHSTHGIGAEKRILKTGDQMTDSKEAKKGFINRVGVWGLRKLRTPTAQMASRKALLGGLDMAKDGLRPARLRPVEAEAAFIGRYADGGRARFEQLRVSLNLSSEDLARLEDANRSHAFINLVIASGLVTIGMFILIFMPGAVMPALVLAFLSLAFLLLWLKHDFAAWQISRRGFPGLRAYLEVRAPIFLFLWRSR
jgi:hypothetical protein